MGLWLLKVTIGYGLGRAYLRALIWIAALTALGTFVLWSAPNAQAKELLWCGFASFDQLLPIVELNKEFGEFFGKPELNQFGRGQLIYFALHSLFGFLLSAFIAAGLAGLTQARRVDRP
jgi:hypothetical protein